MAKSTRQPATKTPQGDMRPIRCYLCGHRQEVSTKALSTNCPKCNKAIRIEDVVVKSYTPVNDLDTCGRIEVTKKGRVAAKRIRAGDGVTCEGIMHGSVETAGDIIFGPKAEWKGEVLRSRRLVIVDGVKLEGHITVPWNETQEGVEPKSRRK